MSFRRFLSSITFVVALGSVLTAPVYVQYEFRIVADPTVVEQPIQESFAFELPADYGQHTVNSISTSGSGNGGVANQFATSHQCPQNLSTPSRDTKRQTNPRTA